MELGRDVADLIEEDGTSIGEFELTLRLASGAGGLAPGKAVVPSRVNFNWNQTLSRPEFYLLYTMSFFACAGGLIATT